MVQSQEKLPQTSQNESKLTKMRKPNWFKLLKIAKST